MSYQSDSPALTVLYDGQCPLCSREIAFLRRRPKSSTLGFFDISAPEADLSPFNLTRDQAMKALYAVRSDGTTLRGMDAIREIYRSIGMSWVVAPTAWPLLRPMFDLAYTIFAKVRPLLARSGCADGRCSRS